MPPSINPVATPYAFPHVRLGSPSDKVVFIDDIQRQKGYFPDQQGTNCFVRFTAELQGFLIASARRQVWYDPHTAPEISDKVSQVTPTAEYTH
jgi:hypothetical protein